MPHSDQLNRDGEFRPFVRERVSFPCVLHVAYCILSLRVFDDYWMNYLTPDMARAIDSHVPYRNLKEYQKWRGGR